MTKVNGNLEIVNDKQNMRNTISNFNFYNESESNLGNTQAAGSNKDKINAMRKSKSLANILKEKVHHQSIMNQSLS